MTISTDYLLSGVFSFPDVKSMMLKGHPSNLQELKHLFQFLQAKNAFKDNLRKKRQNNQKYFYTACWLLKQFPTCFKFHFLYNSPAAAAVLGS